MPKEYSDIVAKIVEYESMFLVNARKWMYIVRVNFIRVIVKLCVHSGLYVAILASQSITISTGVASNMICQEEGSPHGLGDLWIRAKALIAGFRIARCGNCRRSRRDDAVAELRTTIA